MNSDERWIRDTLPEMVHRCQHDEVRVHLQAAQAAFEELVQNGTIPDS